MVVCTTELGTVAKYAPQFEKRSCKMIGLSCNDESSHQKWVADIDEVMKTKVQFPIIADPDRVVARRYGMLGYQDDTPKVRSADEGQRAGPHRPGEQDQQPKLPLTVRAVFIIDPKHEIRAILTYPATCGR